MSTNSNVAASLHDLSTALHECRRACAEPRPAGELAACLDQLMIGVEELRALGQGSLEKTLRMLALVNDRRSVGVAFDAADGAVVLYVDKLEWSITRRHHWERRMIGFGSTLDLAAIDAVKHITDEQLLAHSDEIVIG